MQLLIPGDQYTQTEARETQIFTESPELKIKRNYHKYNRNIVLNWVIFQEFGKRYKAILPLFLQ